MPQEMDQEPGLQDKWTTDDWSIIRFQGLTRTPYDDYVTNYPVLRLFWKRNGSDPVLVSEVDFAEEPWEQVHLGAVCDIHEGKLDTPGVGSLIDLFVRHLTNACKSALIVGGGGTSPFGEKLFQRCMAVHWPSYIETEEINQ